MVGDIAYKSNSPDFIMCHFLISFDIACQNKLSIVNNAIERYPSNSSIKVKTQRMVIHSTVRTV